MSTHLKQICSLAHTAEFPNTVNFERDQDIPQWQHVPLKVPLFSIDELPLKEPAALPTYSIGEEISNSAPIAIAWSSPGLAKHRRCALAALTANLVLSIWSAEGSLQEESSWSRRLIVNYALENYFHNCTIGEPIYVASPSEERMRLRTRIRAFAWAPPLPCLDLKGIVGTRLAYGQHIMAVSNDDNEVAFVVIDSPASTFGAESKWSTRVLTHLSLLSEPRNISSSSPIFEDIMKEQRHVSHLAWSPWVARGEIYNSVIVYATNDDVRATVVTYEQDNIKLSNEIIYPNIDVRFNGPMKWSTTTKDGDLLTLALFTHSGLICLVISSQDASIVEEAVHDLDGRWDSISGAVWDSAQRSTPRLHVSSLLSSLQTPVAVLEPSSNGLLTLNSPNWKDQIDNNLVLFSVKNDLKGNSRVKVWGLAISPLGDFVAACNSVHPSDMIEYGPPGDRRGTVAINTLQQYSQHGEAFPSWNVSAESVLFTVKKLAENAVENADQIPAFADDIIKKLLQAYTRPQDPKDGAHLSLMCTTSSSFGKSIEEFKKIAYLNPLSLKDRYTVLVTHACKTTTSNDIPIVLIAYRLAVLLVTFLSKISDTPFSTEILSHHRALVSLIDRVTAEPKEMETLSISRGNTDSIAGKDDVNTGHEHAELTPDTCDFCLAPIPFTDLTVATCTNGHSFPRCGLSFLAIQAPGITKYCGICNTPFLNEEFVTAQEVNIVGNDAEAAMQSPATALANARGDGQANGMAAQRASRVDHEIEVGRDTQEVYESRRFDKRSAVKSSRREPPMTLARLLFLGCDACVYCGGKFTG